MFSSYSTSWLPEVQANFVNLQSLCWKAGWNQHSLLTCIVTPPAVRILHYIIQSNGHITAPWIWMISYHCFEYDVGRASQAMHAVWMEPGIFRENRATQRCWTFSSSVTCLHYADERPAHNVGQLTEHTLSRASVMHRTPTILGRRVFLTPGRPILTSACPDVNYSPQH